MKTMQRVAAGDRVEIHFDAKAMNGSVFDTSRDGSPLAFVAGEEGPLPRVGQALVQMTLGEHKTVRLPPELAFGVRREELVFSVPRGDLPDNVSIGDHLEARVDDKEFAVVVRNLDAQQAVLDANHPLAGQPVEIEFEVVSIEPPAGG
jgi:peptidylprolyl isomerase